MQTSPSGRVGSGVLAVAFILSACACGGTTPAGVASLTISPPSQAVGIGTDVTFTVTARDGAGATVTDNNVVWSIDDTSVATVNGAGTVHGVSAGTATVAARDPVAGLSATATVSVADNRVGLQLTLGGTGGGRVTSSPGVAV